MDSLCFAGAAADFAKLDATFLCEGTPVMNPQAGQATDASVARKPGGAAGNCTDTDDNSVDFAGTAPATPLDSTSPPTP